MSGLKRFGGVLAFVLAAATPASAQQATAAGHIKTVTGGAFVIRQSTTIPARPGEAVFATDILRTEAGGALGITLRDDTRISLGPDSEVRIDRYVYAPGEGGLGMVLKFARGVAVYVSGRIAKLAPDSIRLEAPAAIVGVRGTTLAIRVGA